MQEWTPEIDFKKADFQYNKDKKVSEFVQPSDIKIQTTKNNHKEITFSPKTKETTKKETEKKIQKKIQKWMPPKLEELSNKKKENSPKDKNKTPLKQNTIKEEKPQEIKTTQNDQLKEYLNEIVMSYLKETTDILKKWYWEKETIKIKYINIILRSLKKHSLVSVFQLFTPNERKQFIQIYKYPIKFNQGEILLARKEFLNQLQNLIQ
ncbi:MAG: hypothetical protein NZ853_05245 [Leptospiraceae bacterium]|nr:hypothetical protein [Leptospiraceae bacterium]MDW7976647.1 hypothetical protein [Leptospiraceae bacterium]